MKRVLVCIGVLLLMTAAARPQSKNKRSASKTGQSKNKAVKPAIDSVITLNSTGSYPAKTGLSSNAATNQFTISDPILKALDARANGANIKISGSGVVGMPKGAYGFANGHLTLKTTGATTFGTQTGSGAVSTGTSLGTFGSLGPAMGVNGKSPYAGTIMWGTARNMYLPLNRWFISGNPSFNLLSDEKNKPGKRGQ